MTSKPSVLRRFPPPVPRFKGNTLPYRDQVTGLRLLPTLYSAIEKALKGGGEMAVLSVEVLGFSIVEKLCGLEVRDRCLAAIGKILDALVGQSLRDEDVALLGYAGGSDFAVFLSAPRKKRGLEDQDLAQVSARVEAQLADLAGPLVAELPLTARIQFRVGHAVLSAEQGAPVQGVVYRALQQARARASDDDWPQKQALQDALIDIIQYRRVSAVFQPIASLVDGEVMGYEALTRSQSGVLSSPDRLFDAAEEFGLLYPLERLCRQEAIRTAANLPGSPQLFLNISPQILEDPTFSGITRDLVEAEGIAPSRVVLEITERYAIKDFELFRTALEHYRRQGFSIAVDDAGAGHSSLRAVAALRPEIIKIDLSLVRDIDSDRAKHALVSALVTFAKRIDALVLAEGIETEAELNTLIDVGVPFGQGYLLGRPAPGFHALPPELVTQIREQVSLREKQLVGKPLLVGDVAKPAATIGVEEPGSNAEHCFRAAPALRSIVVTDDDRPVGLLTREKFFGKLGSRYGYAVFASRSVREAMGATRLIVQADEPIDLVSRKAVHRREDDAYDPIVVTQDDKLIGVVSVLDLLDATTRRQLSIAKYSNPLSGLPGNVLIQTETERRLSLAHPFVFCHVDLDHFKHFNDRFGFSAGDGVILVLAQVIQEITGTASRDFVGHIGGDDFVVITEPARAVETGRSIVREFRAKSKDAAQPEAQNRRGKGAPKITVSIGAVTCGSHMNFHSISELASAAKKLAKARRGDAFVLDSTDVPLSSPPGGVPVSQLPRPIGPTPRSLLLPAPKTAVSAELYPSLPASTCDQHLPGLNVALT